jgi:hypothetical protein
LKYEEGDVIRVSGFVLAWRIHHIPMPNTCDCRVDKVDPTHRMYLVNPQDTGFAPAWWVYEADVLGLVGNLVVGPQPFNVTINIKPSGACCTRCKEFNPYQESAFECYRCKSNWGWMPKEA